jgi:hypothetical protein
LPADYLTNQRFEIKSLALVVGGGDGKRRKDPIDLGFLRVFARKMLFDNLFGR